MFCNHCFGKLTRSLYQPKLCQSCWNDMTMRISELVNTENKYEKLLKKIKKHNIIIPEDDEDKNDNTGS
jgi:transcription elongation factor Elf1